jgi:fumarylacetoacetate (FAA) hydrolase
MTFDFGTLIAHAGQDPALTPARSSARARCRTAGADGGPGKPVSEGGLGYSCIAEQSHGRDPAERARPQTPFLHRRHVRIEMLDDKNHSIFGAIEQTVEG